MHNRFVLLERSKRKKEEEIAKAKKVLLIGGGKAGQIILRDIKTAQELKDIVCRALSMTIRINGEIHRGRSDCRRADDIMSCVERYHIDKIIVALPSATAEEKRDILNICKETGCELKEPAGSLSVPYRRSKSECSSADVAGRGTART
ncbi:MAG: nucleoside-diphosphate sugar epimerase/dehydratase [Mediterraneibacter gnavus]